MTVVTDLNLIIEDDAVFNNGVSQGATIYRRVGPDLNIIANHHASCLRDLNPPCLFIRETKAISANHGARMNSATLTDHTVMINTDIGIDTGAITNDDSLTDCDTRADVRIFSDDRTCFDRGLWTYYSTFSDLSQRTNQSAWMDSRFTWITAQQSKVLR